ncbi:uncharacterized protein LOC127276788 [Leptopilina boulardi]|uniref:uncharacterized protein LOC127276788 n=1 Tax=Leptopilina boulardi TaxID=63433 RepID=UPI0021F59D14|nr:uncharacterized protein LOC127276788 [Leptopilina boulardi]
MLIIYSRIYVSFFCTFSLGVNILRDYQQAIKMKLLSIFILIAVLFENKLEAFESTNLLGNDKGLNEKLIKLIEKFKDYLRKGNESFGLPVMDPFTIKHQELPMKSELFSGEVKINNLQLLGLSNYNVVKADLKIVGLKLMLALHWPGLNLIINNYEIDGVALKFIDVYGKGSLKMNLNSLNFTTTVSVSTNKSNKTLFIKEMNSEVSLEDFQFLIDGLFNDKDLSDMTNAIVSDLVPSIIKTYQKKLTSTINNLVITRANEILRTMTLKDILGLINSSHQNQNFLL